MLPTYLLSLREGLDAALIIGIMLGAVNKIHRKDLAPAVWFVTLSAVIISILTWMIFWMDKQARFLKAEITRRVP